MTPAELTAFRNRARAVAAEHIIPWQTALLKDLLDPLPASAQSRVKKAIRKGLEQGRLECAQVVMEGQPPGYSDLMAGELLDAFDALSKEITATLGL